MTAAVECDGLWRTYGTGDRVRAAVRDVSLRVERGDVVAVTGPSGSGKSTLMHLFAGLDRPTRGTVCWPSTETADGASGRPGIVFQAPSLIPALDVVENVELPLLIAGRVPVDARRRALSALEQLDLEPLAARLPAELSGGQAQRVAVVRALVQEPALLLADEPTGQLDHGAAAQAVQVLVEAATTSGAALVIATHDPTVAECAEQRYVMHDGALAVPLPAGGPA